MQKTNFKFWEKKTELLLALAIILVASTGLITATDLLDSGNSRDLVAEYRFDTGAGNTAYDTAGNNDGTINGASWTDRVEGKALSFDGSDDGVDVPAIENLDAYTISAWTYVEDNGAQGDVWTDFRDNDFRIEEDGSGKMTYHHDDSSGNRYSGSAGLTYGKWQMWTLAWNGSKLFFYRNGEVVDTASPSSMNNPSSCSGTTIGYHGCGGGRYIKGKIDNFRIYNRYLSKSEVKSLYNKGSWRTGKDEEEDDPSKVLDIGFQHQNSTHVFDTSGNGNHGEPMNGASQANAWDCKVGRCYSFDGSDDRVEVTSGSDLDSMKNGYTWMIWFEGRSSSEDYPRLLDFGDTTLRADGPSSDFRAWTSTDGSRCNYVEGDDSTLGNSDKEWYHATFVYNGTHNKLYVDGILNDEGACSGTLDTGYDFTIGAENNGGAEFNGSIDNVKVFDRALSQAEIIEKTQGLQSGGSVLDLRFNRDGGDKVHDFSGEGNHGDLRPNESAGPDRVEGVMGNAVKFDGGAVDVGTGNNLGLDSTKGFTLNTWVKRSSFSGRDEMVLYHTGTDNVRFEIWPSQAGLVYYSSSDDDWTGSRIGLDVDDDKWHQLTWRVKNGNLSMYLDGELEGATELSYDLPNIDGAVDIGDGAGSAENFLGSLDNLKLYPYALSSSKIEDLSQKGKSKIKEEKNSKPGLKDGLVLSQTFNRIETCGQSDTISCPSGMSGEVAVDESGEANHGELVNGPTEKGARECKVGECLEFDGSDRYVKVPDSGSLASNKVSVSAWYILDSTPNGDDTVITTGYQPGFWLEYHNFYVSNGSEQTQAGDISVNVGEWVHVVGTYDGNTVKVYKNGRLVRSSSASYNDIYPGNGAWIGIWENGNSNNFHGKIDQVRVYNRSLSKEEVWKLYTRGRDQSSWGEMAGPVGHWRFDAGPEVCILNQGSLSDGGWGSPSDSELMNTLESEGWNPRYVQVGDITQDGWKSCDVIVFPNSERYPAFDKSADFCGTVNGEGSEHDVFMEMKEFMENGGMWVGTWGAGLWYGKAWDGSSWVDYTSCSQYSGDNLYNDGGQDRCSNIGYSCYNAGDYDYTNINQDVVSALPDTVTSASTSTRWASDLDTNIMQAYNSTSGNTISNSYVGLEKVGDGWYFHPGGNYVFNPGSYEKASMAWNNLLTWYAGNGGQNFWDSAESNEGTISGDGNAPTYTEGKNAEAINFDGADDSVFTGSQIDLGSSGTISAWFKKPSTSGTRMIVDKYSGNYGYSIWFSGNDLYANYGSCDFNSIASPSINTWHHVMLVNSEFMNKCKVFLDGKKIASASSGGDSDVSDEVEIGSRDANSNFWKGKIDDVRIYPYALSQEQVQQVMNSGGVSVGG